eukprot:scaffold1992_cov187-Amphora_coffeaeformis.AAC.22
MILRSKETTAMNYQWNTIGAIGPRKQLHHSHSRKSPGLEKDDDSLRRENKSLMNDDDDDDDSCLALSPCHRKD